MTAWMASGWTPCPTMADTMTGGEVSIDIADSGGTGTIPGEGEDRVRLLSGVDMTTNAGIVGTLRWRPRLSCLFDYPTSALFTSLSRAARWRLA
jgi:hypothetical protein